MTKEIFTVLINQLRRELETANLYDREFAVLTFKDGNETCSVTIRCERSNTDGNG